MPTWAFYQDSLRAVAFTLKEVDNKPLILKLSDNSRKFNVTIALNDEIVTNTVFTVFFSSNLTSTVD